MWVFCCGMYRSASTLQFQMTAQLIKAAGLGEQIGWIDADRFAEVRSNYANAEGLQVIKVHKCTDAIAAEFLKDNAIGIYSFRDVRDVYASMMKQRQKSFDFLWQEGFLTSCLENYKKWTTLPNVLISRYEEIIADVPTEVKRIAEHLKISIDELNCQKIAANYTIAAQTARIEQFKSELLKLERSPNDHRELVDYHDEASLLHLNHIDAVKAGRWQSDLSAPEARAIAAFVSDWCDRNQYETSLFLHESEAQMSGVKEDIPFLQR